MDGLECTEINLSNLERTRRIDSEFYKKECLIIAQILKDINAVPITDYLKVSDGNHMTISDRFQPKGIPYYRGQDIHNFFIESAAPICIDEDAYNNPYMHRSHIKKGDVLLSIVGTIGELALVFSDRKATCSCKLAILRPTSIIFSPLLAIYLKTKYGFNQIEKFKRGAVQMGYLLEDMDQLLIPFFSGSFIKYIAEIVNRAHDIMEESEITYKNAEGILSKEIGFTPSIYFSGQTAIKKLSESFTLTGRLDAEYYQPKYDYIESALKEYDPEIKTLSDIATYVFTGEYSEQYYNKGERKDLRNYIRGTDIKGGEIVQDDNHCINPIGFSKFVSTGDIITGRVGTIGNFGVVTESLNGAVCSDNILCFHLPSEYIPDVYALYFNSELIKDLSLRMARGSVQQRLNQETLKELPVPLIKKDIQYNIQSQVQRAFELRRNAEKLIDIAVKSVEMAIEDSEEVASKWLEENTRLLEG